MFIDTHCHLDFPPFTDNMGNTLSGIAKAHIAAVIVPSVSQSRFQQIQRLITRFTCVYGALGLHPIFEHKETDLQLLDDALARRSEKVVAIGEIGLDKLSATLPMDKQIVLLEGQLQLAQHYRLPIILHSRRTHDVLYKLLKTIPLEKGGVIHGFSGSYQQAMQFIELGFAIGVGGTITYLRANKTRQTIARIPLTSMVLETDAPDMPLCGFQGQANRPEQLLGVFKSLCGLRTENSAEIEHQLFQNSKTLFNLMI